MVVEFQLILYPEGGWSVQGGANETAQPDQSGDWFKVSVDTETLESSVTKE